MMVQLDIDLLRNFAAIAESGAMSRAAERVGRTQAALSQQTKKLEIALQRTLLTRTARGVKLTVDGERLLEHAQKVLRAHDEAVAEMSGASLSGKVRLGCPDDYARAFLPPLLQSFSRLYPRVLIEVVCASSPRLLERQKDNALDIAIVSVPDSPQRDQFLRRERLVWVGAKGGDAFHLDPLQLALSEPDTLDHNAATSSLERVGRRYRIAYASSSLTGLNAVVRSGRAITVLSQAAILPDLQVLPPSSGLPPLPFMGVTVKTALRNSSTLLSRFDAHIRLVLPTL